MAAVNLPRHLPISLQFAALLEIQNDYYQSYIFCKCFFSYFIYGCIFLFNALVIVLFTIVHLIDLPNGGYLNSEMPMPHGETWLLDTSKMIRRQRKDIK